MKLWKALGVAGLAGVAATGVVVARAERRRRTFEPDDVRARLHERYQEAAQPGAAAPGQPEDVVAGPAQEARRGCAGLRKRRRRQR